MTTGEWLNSLIIHDNVKCITANGYTIIYIGAHYYISHDDHSFHVIIFGEHKVILNIRLWLCAASYDWSNSMPIRLHYNYIIHSVHKKITLKNCLAICQ